MSDEQHPVTDTSASEPLARERLYLSKLKELEHEVTELKSRIGELARAQANFSAAVRSHDARLDRLRLDKQLAGFPSWMKKRLIGQGSRRPRSPSPHQLLVIAPKYPTERGQYGGQPVQRRMRYLRAAGYQVTVLADSSRPQARSVHDGVTVVRAPFTTLPQLVASVAPAQILVHHPVPEIWNEVEPFVGDIPVHVWIHGFEARSWRETLVNYSESEIEEIGPRLDAVDVDRQIVLRDLFPDERVTKIFVSEYMRSVAEAFAGVAASNAHVIHNVIDDDLFGYVPRHEDDRFRVLSIKSYANRTYATDLIAPVIEELSHQPDFERFRFEIRGEGRFFDDDTRGLGRFSNVTVTRGVLDVPEIADLTAGFGAMLLPTRLDSQGMMMGEAMSRGMVVVTNRVAAIPEFADESCAVVVDAEDVKGMAAAVVELASDPTRFLHLSAAAAARAKTQCGPSATVAREIELLRESATPPG